MTTTAAEPDADGGVPAPHGVVGFARSLHGALDRVEKVPVWSMTRGEEQEALVALDRAETRLATLRMRVLAQADRDLEDGFTATGGALSVGGVNLDQAGVILAAVNRLSTEHDDLPPGTRERAEAHLLDLAGDFDAVVLRRLGRRLFEVVCPEAADAAEGEQLRKDEERARRVASFSMRGNGDGTHQGHFRLPYPVLLGHGLMEFLEGADPDTLPSQGGSPFTLVITMTIEALPTGIGVAGLDTGEKISAGEARRLACKAGIIPMVLDGRSVPLDLGRERRLYTKHQRIALAHTHGGCAAKDCDRPPAWTETHHQMADHPESWNMKTHPSGAVRFNRRQ